MASIIRPALMRRSCAATPSPRFISTAIPSARFAGPVARPITRPVARANAQDAFNSRMFGVVRIASFHTSGQKQILPPLPQRISGGVNSPAPVPDPSPTHGSYHWTMERLVSVALIPVTVAPFIGGSLNPLLDATLCGLLIVHTHTGFQSVITDYVPRWRIPGIRKTFDWGLLAGTFVVAYGMYEFETNDVGLTEAIKQIWHAQA